MASSCFSAASIILLIVLELSGAGAQPPASPPFSDAYSITWGEDHVQFLDDGAVQLSLDNSSGAGFESRSYYGSGYFDMDIQLPNNSAGVVTAFYITSHTDAHDELDFEFLGDDEGTSIIVQTNVFVNGVGGREEKMSLWFDPTEGQHNYTILWNYNHIVFYVDATPIRIFSNKSSMGAPFPSQSMQITASIWDGSTWATEGGRKKVDWGLAPFTAIFQDFSVDGCPSSDGSSGNCYSPNDWWSQGSFVDIPIDQLAKYQQASEDHLVYNYCDDGKRYPRLPPECPE